MIKIIVLGHGGYAEGVRLNMEMIAGPCEAMHFIDLTKDDDLASFQQKVVNLTESFSEDKILFVCDLLGATPFRVAAELSAVSNGKYYTVAGLNTMAFLELSMSADSELSIKELAERSVETTKTSVSIFPA
ncbi:MAG: system fructose subfamily component [Firmicutes bacterium]|nr:system fructose subfamily component [Bacillota bacterium]